MYGIVRTDYAIFLLDDSEEYIDEMVQELRAILRMEAKINMTGQIVKRDEEDLW